MSSSPVTSTVVIFFCAAVQSLKYSDLEDMGIACPRQDKCQGYKNDLSYTKRNCECDSDCSTYNDCCIDAPRRQLSGQAASQMKNMMCLNYAENMYTGIYAVSKCSREWNGDKEVKNKCEGSPDLSYPIGAAPITSTSRKITYKNLFCAECNNADMQSLKLFNIKMSCEGVEDLTQDQIMEKLSYDQQKKKWGVYRGDTSGFKECQILFDLPTHLNGSVRFCRANIISKCAPDWTRPQTRRACEE